MQTIISIPVLRRENRKNIIYLPLANYPDHSIHNPFLYKPLNDKLSG
ncbi:hypothetical protein KKB18_06480 [bacterium]|nr:hypothetical protein [bacterium]